MKRLLSFLLLSVMLNYFSCNKRDTHPEYPFIAEVLGKNADCGLFAIKITNDVENAKAIIGNSVSEGVYIAKNLPAELQTAGLVIALDIRKPNASELDICAALGPGYTWLYITKAILY